MSESLRVAVVGVGYLGRFHAKIYSELEGVDLVTVVDTDPERAEAVAGEYGCAWTTDPAELPGAVDAVSVVVPTRSHLEVARPLLEAGIHMLIEKPIARTTEEGEELVGLAEKAGVLLQVGHVERYNAGVMALAEHVHQPRFIEAHRIGGFPARATDVDVVTDLMIHDIDIILSLVDSPIRTVSAVGLPVITEHVDIANARLEFENGCIANVTASRVSNQTLRRIRIFEAHCYEALDFIEQQGEVIRALRHADKEWPEIVREPIGIVPRKPLDAELADFVAKVRDGGTPLVDGHAGLEALRVAQLINRRMAEWKERSL
ncbi:MAG: Gfo/Idh/MocA family oxidoreductase [Gammaproteobacteria bacterium]|nr:Gfo/Idh/MocA family oxidoreductase [Gammaproteobacteria bacterium]